MIVPRSLWNHIQIGVCLHFGRNNNKKREEEEKSYRRNCLHTYIIKLYTKPLLQVAEQMLNLIHCRRRLKSRFLKYDAVSTRPNLSGGIWFWSVYDFLVYFFSLEFWVVNFSLLPYLFASDTNGFGRQALPHSIFELLVNLHSFFYRRILWPNTYTNDVDTIRIQSNAQTKIKLLKLRTLLFVRKFDARRHFRIKDHGHDAIRLPGFSKCHSNRFQWVNRILYFTIRSGIKWKWRNKSTLRENLVTQSNNIENHFKSSNRNLKSKWCLQSPLWFILILTAFSSFETFPRPFPLLRVVPHFIHSPISIIIIASSTTTTRSIVSI